ncbi:glycerol-3-phosphate 1-O-acyltransferase PlsY [Haliangium ochraceum]|uniref:Glycerol-3-phosphate acyltransferase n=1 Tax=Haliangium ochraceum (strain DSM 14365 / JCM 11303 / SMP-2) TaxID=502025 RepID=D0LRT6_HALO1|nr:glycerol-3-phosphate 1-O-acyltransferase PlsY [Haliangium ochraceum]ACY19078.1 protein of unknown function DUF205 [Haliangium ochraceum DSM 14365]
MPTSALAFAFAAYLLGSIPVGLLLARRRGVDVRRVGSGNIGATNVARSLGKKLGIVVLLGDLLKGALPLLAFRWLGLDRQLAPVWLTIVGVAPVLGHCFPLWLRLRGGKGVSTSLGVFLVLAPALAGLGVLAFALLYRTFRIASVGSMGAAISVATALWLFDHPPAEVQLGIAIALIILIQHRQNIRRLFGGSELRV